MNLSKQKPPYMDNREYILSAKSNYGKDEIEELYRKNRQSYKIYRQNSINTSLRLGFGEQPKPKHEKKPLYEYQHPPNLISQHSGILSNSTPMTSSTTLLSKYPSSSVIDINSPDVRAIKRDLMLRNKDWDFSTNDNVINSDYNRKESKNGSIYNYRQRAECNYLGSQCSNILLEAAKLNHVYTQAKSPKAASSMADSNGSIASNNTNQQSSDLDNEHLPMIASRKSNAEETSESKNGPDHISSPIRNSYMSDVPNSLPHIQQSSEIRKSVTFDEINPELFDVFGTGNTGEGVEGGRDGHIRQSMAKMRNSFLRQSKIMNRNSAMKPIDPNTKCDNIMLSSEGDKKRFGELAVVDTTECEQALAHLCLQFKSKYDLPIRTQPINQTIKFKQMVELESGGHTEVPVALTLYDVGYEFQTIEPENPLTIKPLEIKNVNTIPFIPAEIPKTLRTSTGLLALVHIDIPQEQLPPDTNPKDLVSYQYFSFSELFHMTKSADAYQLRNFINEMLNFSYPYSGKTTFQTTQTNERGKGKKGNKFKMMNFEQVILVDQDQKRAMVYYCLYDMIDKETLCSLLDLIKTRIRIQCDPWMAIRLM